MEKSRGHGSVFGSFILDRRGTLLGFDDELETLTGWPAVTIVGRNGSQRRRAVDGGTAPTLFDGEIALPDDSRHINLVLNCRDGRKLETESRITRLAGPGEQMLVTILRVISLSAVKPAPEHGNHSGRGFPFRFRLVRRDTWLLFHPLLVQRPNTGLLRVSGVNHHPIPKP